MVLVPAGVAAQVQGHAWWYLLILALFSAAGRIIAACLLYVIADKSENWIFSKGRRFWGINHEDVAALGKRFHHGWRDWWTLFLLNAVPIIPTSFLSLACGFIKIPFATFITATLLGTIVNSVAYLSIGYAGLEILTEFSGFDLAFQIAGGLALVALVVWWLARKKQKRRHS